MAFTERVSLNAVNDADLSAANPVPVLDVTGPTAVIAALTTRLDRLISRVEDLTVEVQRLRLGMIWAESPVCVDLESELSPAGIQEE